MALQQFGGHNFDQTQIECRARQPHLKTACAAAPAIEAECREMRDEATRNLRVGAIPDEILPFDFADLQLWRTDGLARCGDRFQAEQYDVAPRSLLAHQHANLVEGCEVDAEERLQGRK